jgi:hypothetical protein
MTSFSSIAYSIAMLAAFLLAGGGLYMGLARRDWKKGALMLLVAAVLVANVVIWTVPVQG